MSLTTPESIRTLQRKLYLKAKAEPGFRFHQLYDKVWRADFLAHAYALCRSNAGAPGVDGVTFAMIEAAGLEGWLSGLCEELRQKTYRAQPVRRVMIPKPTGGERPLGIPTFEDKVLQRAITMLLEAVYEQDFMDCSYGFRPRRSARDALETMRTAAVVGAGGWVVEIDIRKFFDSVDRKVLKEVLRQRVRDGVVLRLVSKWLAAGVMEDGAVTRPTSGTPQGGVVSPILANILLHDVLDLWFERDVRPRLRQRGTLVRYADDAVMVFSNEEDARRVLEVLPKRFGRFGLALHPEKTKIGDCQDRCRVNYAAKVAPAWRRTEVAPSVGRLRGAMLGGEWAPQRSPLSTRAFVERRLGLSATSAGASQLRMRPLQRSGCAARAFS